MLLRLWRLLVYHCPNFVATTLFTYIVLRKMICFFNTLWSFLLACIHCIPCSYITRFLCKQSSCAFKWLCSIGCLMLACLLRHGAPADDVINFWRWRHRHGGDWSAAAATLPSETETSESTSHWWSWHHPASTSRQHRTCPWKWRNCFSRRRRGTPVGTCDCSRESYQQDRSKWAAATNQPPVTKATACGSAARFRAEGELHPCRCQLWVAFERFFRRCVEKSRRATESSEIRGHLGKESENLCLTEKAIIERPRLASRTGKPVHQWQEINCDSMAAATVKDHDRLFWPSSHERRQWRF